jgi:hypothetical protein
MTELMTTLPDTVSDARGSFRAWVMASASADGRWEGWLEFVPAEGETSAGYATPIETHQHDRATMALWASGLSHVYAEGALGRAILQRQPQVQSQLLVALHELVEALDRRIPQIERVGEADITADASRLRSRAVQRIALLRGNS